MAEKKAPKETTEKKSQIAEREEEILAFWNKNEIFKKSMEKDAPGGDFVFYDGPPFATGQPHYGHILAGTMKDVIPRFQTMRGKRVLRKWGWDCHGLPVENLIEKELGLKSKKDIEEIGVEKFNEAARASVLRYDADWKKIVPRSGRWVDMDDAYLTMNPPYMESVWWSFKKLFEKGLIYEGFKSMHLCPRCETTLSNFEVNQGYKDIVDISVFVKFELTDEPHTYVLAWTTTPWTLPGNVALAVNPEIDYIKLEVGTSQLSEFKEGEKYIFANSDASVARILGSSLTYEGSGAHINYKNKGIVVFKNIEQFKGRELVGKSYKPLFDYYVNDEKVKNRENGWKIYPGEFVSLEEGTGVVHIAPAFGEEDYQLSLKYSIPFVQHIATNGTFKKEATDFAGLPAKPKSEEKDGHQKTDIEIIKYLAHHHLLFDKLKITHSYPHCWRCDTPLLNYASSSWFVNVTKIKELMIAENQAVTWIPQEIGEGRFGKWLEGARDWAVSRTRYWGSTLPVWRCEKCEKLEVIGSVDEVKQKTTRNNSFIFLRHGQSEHNVQNICNSDPKVPFHLTEKGRKEVEASAKELKSKKISHIYVSPLPRAQESAEIVAEVLGISKDHIVTDKRLNELDWGNFEGKSFSEFLEYEEAHMHDYVHKLPGEYGTKLEGGESYQDAKNRTGDFMYEVDAKHAGEHILVVAHGIQPEVGFAVAEGADKKRSKEIINTLDPMPGSFVETAFARLPHNRDFELDLHRPYIDEVTFACSCGGTMKKIPEVFDTWYESGSMPYAQFHYPFENLDVFNAEKNLRFPADFIGEGQDQTRGWFYTLLVLSTGLFGSAPYKHVLVNGTILAEDGQKMSKRLKNYPDVEYVFDKYGADAMRYYLLSSPAVRASDLAFTEKGLDEVTKKLTMRLQNVYSFYEMYRAGSDFTDADIGKSKNILDEWITARLVELCETVTVGLENYELDRAARPLLDFVDDLSTWYLRRSRDRFKGEDKHDRAYALQTIHVTLREFSKLLAPFMPFLAEDMYKKVTQDKEVESVHLVEWPSYDVKLDKNLLDSMATVRKVVSLGLEVRARAGIKVRQPLAAVFLKTKISEELASLITDELNVKKVEYKPDQTNEVEIDTNITDELKREGYARDIIRFVQDMRKKAGLMPEDEIILTIKTDKAGEAIVDAYKSEIMRVTGSKEIVFGHADGEEKLSLDNLTFVIGIKN